MLRTFGSVGLALVLVGGLAGCGDDDADDAAEGGASTTTVADDAEAEAVDVVLSDYAYDVSGELPAGGTVRLRNDGEEVHMVGIGRLLDGATLEDVEAGLESDDESALDGVLEEIGLPGGLITPGSTAELTVPDLEVGEYALICFLPAVGSGAPHFSLGMVSTLTITDEEATPADGDVASSATPGEAIDGPAEIDAGHHVFDLTVGGDASDLEPLLLRIPDGEDAESVFATLDEDFEAGFSAEGGPDVSLGAAVAELMVVGWHDFGDDRTVQLGFDLEPGDYALVLADTDAEEKDLTARWEFSVS